MPRALLISAVIAALGMCRAAIAVGPEPIPLWEDGAPGAIGDEPADRPEIRIYRPESNAVPTAVVVCPGGGYGALAMDHEGHQIGQWLNTIGVTAVVLKYRHAPRYHHPAPLTDVQRAIRYTRAHAAELGVERVGVMGFSAGGHLASTVSTHFDAGDDDSDDLIEHQSCRPDFSILAYPVISLTAEYSHRGSARNLLGENPDPELAKSLSNETQVTAETPPTFIFQTADDQAVNVRNALAYYGALVEHGVNAELHVYQHGPHGVGLAAGHPALSSWPGRLADWLKANGFLMAFVETGKVSGSVSLDGEPLRWGSIVFLPTFSGPCGWALVSRGKYSVSRELPTGDYRVEIRDLGGVEPTPTIAAEELLYPSGYLAANVATGDNVFDFVLESR